MAIFLVDMATITVKSTYSLDPETVRTLERMAKRWRVSKSEALRRAIRAAAQMDLRGTDDPLKALDALQRALRIRPGQAREWERRVRAERDAASPRRAGRSGE